MCLVEASVEAAWEGSDDGDVVATAISILEAIADDSIDENSAIIVVLL